MIKFSIKSIAAFCVAAVFASCNYDDTGVGQNLLPDEDMIKPLITDTITVQSFTERVDTLNTSQVAKVIVGRNIDPIFGTTQASFAMQFGFYINSDSVNIIVNDVYLKFSYSTDSVYGHTSGTGIDLEVYELSKRLYADSTYYSNLDPESLHDGNLLGAKRVFPGTYEDTAAVYIPLNHEFANRIFQADDNVYENDTTFKDTFKGILVKAGASTNAILKLSIDTGTYINIRYQYSADSDTLDYKLYINGTNNAKINMFTHDYSSSVFQNEINAAEPQQTYSYIQGMAGLNTKIRFPYLETFKTSEKLNLYRAELILPVADETFSISGKYPEAQSLIILGETSDGEQYLLNEYRSSAGTYVGEYFDEDTKTYHFNITKHIHDILYENAENMDLNILILGGSTNMYRAVLHSGSNSVSPIKLVLTYSTL